MPALRYREVVWKKNLMKPSAALIDKIKDFRGAAFKVVCIKEITLTEIKRGDYLHLGVSAENGALNVIQPVVPPVDMGKYSQRNIEGWEVVRRDLTKIPKTRGMESPNFGDWSKGSHTNWITQNVYPREYYEARDTTISVEMLREPANDAGKYVIKFSVDYVLQENADDFSSDLMFALNLLQENTGKVDVALATTTREEFLRTLSVDWEIFPPGNADEIIATLTTGTTKLSYEQKQIVEDRVRQFARLKPEAYIRGLGGQNSYIGAKFAEDFVVFENIRYGNALYVLYENWREVSQRPRTDLLKGTDAAFERIVHVDGWEDRLQKLIRAWRNGARRA